jgi:hypothetical protein
MSMIHRKSDALDYGLGSSARARNQSIGFDSIIEIALNRNFFSHVFNAEPFNVR